jgi:hypothetical protein
MNQKSESGMTLEAERAEAERAEARRLKEAVRQEEARKEAERAEARRKARELVKQKEAEAEEAARQAREAAEQARKVEDDEFETDEFETGEDIDRGPGFGHFTMPAEEEKIDPKEQELWEAWQTDKQPRDMTVDEYKTWLAKKEAHAMYVNQASEKDKTAKELRDEAGANGFNRVSIPSDVKSSMDSLDDEFDADEDFEAYLVNGVGLEGNSSSQKREVEEEGEKKNVLMIDGEEFDFEI